jgi:hypothetical protein
MKCISPYCTTKERTQHIQDFMGRMELSGYNKGDRTSVYMGAKKKFEKQVNDHAAGIRPLYRPKSWNKTERKKLKKEKKRNWYGINYDGVYFVQPTINGLLAKKCRRIFQTSKLKIKVVERSGRSMRQLLTTSNPFTNGRCPNENCCVCTRCSPNTKHPCKTRECVYEIKCNTCSHTYIGETSRSLEERIKEHLHLYDTQNKNSVLFQHASEKHTAQQDHVQWSVRVRAKCPSDAALRQATEATLISIEKPTLNKKSEFGDQNRC